jgi:hypothetical protein
VRGTLGWRLPGLSWPISRDIAVGNAMSYSRAQAVYGHRLNVEGDLGLRELESRQGALAQDWGQYASAPFWKQLFMRRPKNE